MRPYRILVTGSRKWADADAVRTNLAVFGTPRFEGREVVVVHGDAHGADTIAAEVGRSLGFTVEPHPADWTTHGKRAGPIRNQAMVDLGADICLAFPTTSSVGTWDCVRRANRAGIRVIVVPERKP